MRKIISVLLLLALPVAIFAQSNPSFKNLKVNKKSKLIGDVTVGSSSFEASSAFTVTATDQGMLVPRMTTAQRDAIGSPATGLLIFNTTTNQFEFFESTWQAVGAGGNTIYSGDDNLTGDRTVSIGTNDLTFATTGESNLLEIDGDNDRIGIGIATPLYRLQIETTTSDAIPAFAIRTGGNNAVELWNRVTDGGGILTRKAAGTISMSLGIGSSDFINTGNDLSIGFSTAAGARLNIRGVNAANTESALLVEDNAGTDLFEVKNGGDVEFTTAAFKWTASSKFLTLTGSVSTNILTLDPATEINLKTLGVKQVQIQKVGTLTLRNASGVEQMKLNVNSTSWIGDNNSVGFGVNTGSTISASLHVRSHNANVALFAVKVDNNALNLPLLYVQNNGNIGVGTSSPATSAILDITSTTGAVLFPRMTTAQRDALTGIDGMVIYNTTLSKLQVFAGGGWVSLH